MKIAIAKASDSYGVKQVNDCIQYCQDKGVDYKLVNPYASDIVSLVSDCEAFIWYIYHTDYRDMLFGKELLGSLQLAGKKVFPDAFSVWHFDDKLGQKYALESIGAPNIPTHVFYTRKEAQQWMEQTTYPKVLKLRGGAGGRNVVLVKNKDQAKKLIKQAFRKGFSQTSDKWQYLKDQLRMVRRHKRSLKEGLMKGIGIFFVEPLYSRMRGREKGYVMFQDFVQGNDSDWRVIVIGNRLYGMKRRVREGDFRASGSGEYIYEPIPREMMQIAFETAEKLRLQSVAFDFMYHEGKPVIVEMCYGFGTTGSSQCKGYWDRQYQWHDATPNPYYWQIEDLLKKQ